MKQEEMTFKYTTDGKKVVIIGNLNSQEKIVQEVFIVNGNEVPSGENFVVKSLHDAPAISWKEKNTLELEERYSKVKETYDKQMNELNSKLRTQRELLTDKLIHVGRILKNVSENSFTTLVDYLNGNIKYIVTEGWTPELIDFNKVDENCSYTKTNMTLLSIYGKDDGSLSYGLNQYSDGSSGSRAVFTPFNNYEDALAKFKEIVLLKPLNDKIIAICKEYGFTIDPEKLKEYKEKTMETYKKHMESSEKQVESYRNMIAELDKI